MNQPLAIILMGSKSDLEYCQKIADTCQKFGIETTMRIASAHKTAARLLEILAAYETDPRPKVYITVAGRSNALSGMADASVSAPVIACPPSSSSFGGADIYSSLRMPSGVAPLVILEPENAALAVAKIFGQSNPEVLAKVKTYQEEHRQRLYTADEDLNDRE
ncbi:MAG TPA: 5-(carboxyamino)imidazole ribonucleotide mutase [Chloroflexi bacterium]|nr:5-(carboxyamino)imidazole ribonucleotide mutase [Chloroflexota bacterium]